MSDCQRRTLSRGYHQIIIVGKDDTQREGTGQPSQRCLHRLKMAFAGIQVVRDEVDNRFGIAVGLKLMATLNQFIAQFSEVIDFSVKGYPDRAIFIAHRLLPR